MNVQNILLATDFSASSDAALHYATVVAKQYQARLFVVHVISESIYAEVPAELLAEVKTRTVAHVRAKLERLRDSLTEVQAEFFFEEGHVADTLLALIQLKSIDLVVMGTRGHRRMKRLLLGSVAEKVSRQADCPVLVVPESAVSYPPKVTLGAILCPTNFSERSAAALKQAWQFAKVFSAHIVLLHVVEDSPLDRAERIARRTTVRERLSQLSSSISSDESSQEVELVVEFGPVARTIVRVAAERHRDLIILSIQRAKPVVAHLPPDVTYSVVQHADCPVLTITS